MNAGAFAAALRYGLLPAAPVPCRDDGALDRDALGALAAHLSGAPIAGVAVWTQTGRGLHLTPQVAERVLAAWRAALPAPRVVVAGVGARPRVRGGVGRRRVTPPANPLALTSFVSQSTLEMAEAAKIGGADAVLVFPPVLLKNLPDHDTRIVEVHAALRDLGLPALAWYLNENEGGLPYSDRVVDRILALPHVAGLLVSTIDSVVRFQTIAPRVPEDRLLVSGEDRFLGYSLMIGARAALTDLGAIRPALVAALLGAHRSGDWARFHALAATVDALAAVVARDPLDGVPRRILHQLAVEAVIASAAARDPWGPEVPAWQLQELETHLRVPA